jgi:hypothetical protein
MRLYLIGLLCLVGLQLSSTNYALAQEFINLDSTGVYGYTSIDYNPSTNVVTAYSETDDYGGALYYYAVTVNLCSGQTGAAPQCIQHVAVNSSVSFVNATLTYQGAAGNTYTATGQHGGTVTLKTGPASYNDPYGENRWASFNIDDPWQFPFSTFSQGDTISDPTIDLGDTYDVAITTIPAACGDQRDTIIQEYETYATPYYPACSEFTQNTGDATYTFTALNQGTYSWAVLRSYFIGKLNALAQLNTFQINSAYRNPAREKQVSLAQTGGRYHPGSRHQYGDAVDVNTAQATWLTYHNDGLNLGACVEPINVQGNSYAHAHLDWRSQAAAVPHFASCPSGWSK